MTNNIPIKAILICKDRTRKIYRVNRKNRSEDGNTFSTPNKKEYFLKAEKAIFASEKIARIIPKVYLTFYYEENNPEPLDMVNFHGIKFQGISAGDLKAIFTPRFYQIIARAGKTNKREELMFLLLLYTSAAITFIIYMWYKHFGFTLK